MLSLVPVSTLEVVCGIVFVDTRLWEETTGQILLYCYYVVFGIIPTFAVTALMETPILGGCSRVGSGCAWWALPAANNIPRVRSGWDQATVGTGCQVEAVSVKTSPCKVL